MLYRECGKAQICSKITGLTITTGKFINHLFAPMEIEESISYPICQRCSRTKSETAHPYSRISRLEKKNTLDFWIFLDPSFNAYNLTCDTATVLVQCGNTQLPTCVAPKKGRGSFITFAFDCFRILKDWSRTFVTYCHNDLSSWSSMCHKWYCRHEQAHYRKIR